MMKSLFLLFLVLLSVLSSSCKHDYPNDIPQWLKTRILQFKRTGKSNDTYACYESCPLVIDECTETTTKAKLYRFHFCDYEGYSYFDIDGNPLCYFNDQYTCANTNTGCPCGNFMVKNIDFTRHIWTPTRCEN